jgi:nitroreductase
MTKSATSSLDTLSAIEQRRSVKHYDPDFVMPQEDIQTLFSSALFSPTSFNIQNWRFVLVEDPELRKQLRTAAWDQAQVAEASLLVILCGDLKSWENSPERYWETAPKDVRDFLVSAITNFYKDRPEVQRDEVMRSCGIAAQTLMLTAKSLGYDSCPMVGFDPEQVAKLIQLPKDHVIGMMLSIGKALQPARPRGGQLPMADVVIKNHF